MLCFIVRDVNMTWSISNRLLPTAIRSVHQSHCIAAAGFLSLPLTSYEKELWPKIAWGLLPVLFLQACYTWAGGMNAQMALNEVCNSIETK